MFSMVRRSCLCHLSLGGVYLQMMKLNDRHAICEGFEESLGGAVHEEVLVETRRVFCRLPGFIAGLHKMSLKVCYFLISHCLECNWPSCGFISLLSCCMMIPGNDSY